MLVVFNVSVCICQGFFYENLMDKRSSTYTRVIAKNSLVRWIDQHDVLQQTRQKVLNVCDNASRRHRSHDLMSYLALFYLLIGE